jgi:hypothetical protein
MARVSRRIAVAVVVVSTSASPAAADDKQECLDAHAQAQLLRRAGRFSSARARLATCSVAKCPPLVANDCTGWLAELDAEQPTVILAAHDEAGRDVGVLRVTLDGRPLASALDGRPIEVDPGRHVFRGEYSGGRSAEVSVVVRATEKDRVIRLDLPPAPPPPPPAAGGQTSQEAKGGWPPLVYVLGGVGVAALGSFGFFAIHGRSDESHLSSTCRPNCAEADLASVRRSYVVADISLGVAVVALGAATWVLLSGRPLGKAAAAYGPWPAW